MIKCFWSSQLGLKAINIYGFRAYRKNFLPIWFLYDYYIKLFIYFLLEKYYTKEFFILYWFNWFSNYLFYNYFLILFFLNFFNLKYFLFKHFNIILNINFLNIYNFFINIINKKNIYLLYNREWEISICSNPHDHLSLSLYIYPYPAFPLWS